MIRFGLGILMGLTAFRYWLCLHAPVSPSEAYLHMCTRRLDIAFFDGPPGPALLAYWGSKLFTNDLLALRWTAPLFALLATVLIYSLGKKFYGAPAGLASALLLNVLPAFQLSSIQAGGAGPALVFWLLGMLCIWQAWKMQKWRWWGAGGIFLALGLQFSYWLLLAPIACLFCVATRRAYFSKFSLAGCGILFALCLLALTGAIEWNIRQNWIPFSGWTWQTLFHPENLKSGALLELLEQTSIPGACLIGLSLLFCFCNWQLSIRVRFLSAFALPPLLATLVLMSHNELGPVLLAVVPLLVGFGSWWQTASPALSWGSAATCALTALCSTWTLATWPPLTQRGMQKAAMTVEKIARTQSAIFSSQLGEIFLIAETPGIVAEFDYMFDRMDRFNKKGNRPEIFLRESPDLSNQLRLWPSYADFSATNKPDNPLFTEQQGVNHYLGRSALYITGEEGLLPQTISAAFEKIIPLYTLQIRSKGSLCRQLNIYLCRNYQTLPL